MNRRPYESRASLGWPLSGVTSTAEATHTHTHTAAPVRHRGTGTRGRAQPSGPASDRAGARRRLSRYPRGLRGLGAVILAFAAGCTAASVLAPSSVQASVPHPVATE